MVTKATFESKVPALRTFFSRRISPVAYTVENLAWWRLPAGAGNRSFVNVLCRILSPCPGFDLRFGQFNVCVEVTTARPSLTSIFRANDVLLVLGCCR